jgi:hypothetical protein
VPRVSEDDGKPCAAVADAIKSVNIATIKIFMWPR